VNYKEMAAKAESMEGCQIEAANNNAKHMKAWSLWATEPERLVSWEKCGDQGNFYVLGYP